MTVTISRSAVALIEAIDCGQREKRKENVLNCNKMKFLKYALLGELANVAQSQLTDADLLMKATRYSRLKRWFETNIDDGGDAMLAECESKYSIGNNCSQWGDEDNGFSGVFCSSEVYYTGTGSYGPGCLQVSWGASVCAIDPNTDEACTDADDDTIVCPGITLLPPGWEANKTKCSTDGEHTIRNWDESDKCYPPSEVWADFEAGKMYNTYACYTGSSECNGFPWAKQDSFYRARNVGGELTIDLDESYGACSAVVYEAWNSGTLAAEGHSGSEAFFINPVNKALADDGNSLSFESGKITLLGASNLGTGPISFKTADDVIVAGVDNAADAVVEFFNSSSVVVIDTVSAGTVAFTNVVASIYKTISSGEVIVNGGSYNWIGGSNSGDITVDGNPTVNVFLDSHSGNTHLISGTVHAIVEVMGGTLTVEDDVEGSLTVLSGSGVYNIAAGSSFSIESYDLKGTSTTQGITLTGVSTDALDYEEVRKEIECAIQREINATYCANVKITAITASSTRRMRRLTTGLTFTYQVSYTDSEKSKVVSNMQGLSSSTSLLDSLQEITGESSLTMSASSTSEVDTCVGECFDTDDDSGGSSSSDSDDTTMIIIIICVILGIAVAGVGAFFILKSRDKVSVHDVQPAH